MDFWVVEGSLSRILYAMFNSPRRYGMAVRSLTRAAAAAGPSSLAGIRGSGVQEDVFEINDRIDRLSLVVEAMWALMREKGLTDQDLRAMIEKLDAEDSDVDGRRRHQARKCASCQSMVEAGRSTCAICGKAMPDEPTVFAAGT